VVAKVVNFPIESEDLEADSNSHYERLMYTVVMHATKQTFWALTDRLRYAERALHHK
jgi:hypothetical protein